MDAAGKVKPVKLIKILARKRDVWKPKPKLNKHSYCKPFELL